MKMYRKYDLTYDKSEARILLEDIIRKKNIDMFLIRDKIIELEKQIVQLENENSSLRNEISDLNNELLDSEY